jgi:hypothetical protein
MNINWKIVAIIAVVFGVFALSIVIYLAAHFRGSAQPVRSSAAAGGSTAQPDQPFNEDAYLACMTGASGPYEETKKHCESLSGPVPQSRQALWAEKWGNTTKEYKLEGTYSN